MPITFNQKSFKKSLRSGQGSSRLRLINPLRATFWLTFIGASSFLSGLVYGLICPAVQPDSTSAESASTEVTASIDDIISISAPTSASITITPKADSSTFATTSVDVSVTTNSYYGYQLTMGTSGVDSSGDLTTSLISNSTSIPDITTSISDITTSSYDNFTDNSWGFTTNNNGTSAGQIVANTYEPLTTTDSPTLIKSTDSTATADTTTVTFAVKINDEQPAGTYTNTVVFSAVANIVPQDDLLFWGSTDNSANTATTLVDKSGNGNNGTLYNFDDTTSSGWNDGELVFDGSNDYVNLGLASLDLQDGFSLVAYVKINKATSGNQHIFGNWDGSGAGFNTLNYCSSNNYNHFTFLAYTDTGSTGYTCISADDEYNTTEYYTLIGTYDGGTLKFYIDNELIGSTTTSTVKTSAMPFFLGANPGESYTSPTATGFANMTIREALIYDRALTESEVRSLNTIFQKKWQ